MFLNCGKNILVEKKDIIGIFDIDSTYTKGDTKKFLSSAEKKGNIVNCTSNLPKSFILASKKRKCSDAVSDEKIYLSSLSSYSAAGRIKKSF